MAEYTVSTLLSMEKSLRSRLNQLNELKNEVSKRFSWRESDKVEEPTYDIKLVDKKIVKLNNALFELANAVKTSNAKTVVSVNLDYSDLTSEIE